jgi:hypothetical protein
MSQLEVRLLLVFKYICNTQNNGWLRQFTTSFLVAFLVRCHGKNITNIQSVTLSRSAC